MLNILVFPCGSEIGLEIHRSLKYSTHVELFGASSVDDHGRFVYKNYIPNIPFFNDPDFMKVLKKIVEEKEINAIYPAMDSVILKLSGLEEELGCKILGSIKETNLICSSKSSTYKYLENEILVPKCFTSLDNCEDFPVFMKPDIGYGSRGTKLIFNKNEGREHLKHYPNCILLENLPGKEFTVDCFTDRKRNLLFSGARERRRIVNGISVNTIPVDDRIDQFREIAKRINEKIHFRGAWFFQLKENESGELALLEVASRLGGSSSLFRNLGENFSLLTIFDAFDFEVEVFMNNHAIEMDRALNNRYKLTLNYNNVYVDFDDCVLISAKINTELITFLFQVVNYGKKLILLTKHEKDILETLKKMRLSQLFDEVIHIKKSDCKWKYIESDSIFIDDSFAERKEVFQKLKIPVFAPDSVECLIN